ncbi:MULTISPECIES: Fe-S cluster assembly protein SufD [Kordiimonas]|jgi:Fe-S cluster assembly protein SufD|uniref:Fe-S cluster assembly protein SufD n=1 Tax=Kordiimonas TaxID=288021 RepID=UPI00257BA4A7|nr:Fe-S cluster assembly protein SufD [Kordiimonas sp. UBA4487]
MDDAVIQSYEKQAEALEGSVAGMDDLRAKAIKDFAAQGFPHAKAEDWRYSDLKTLRTKTYAPANHAGETPDVPEAFTDCAARFVFVNGRFSESRSDMGDLWQAASVRSLANHFMANPDRAAELVRGRDGVGMLNTALAKDGMVIAVPAGVEIDDPVEIIHIMTGADDCAAHSRHIVELGEGASVHIVERFIGDDSAYWTNSMLQARVTESAVLHHTRLQEEGANAIHTTKAYVNVGAGGQYHACNLSLGAKVGRFEAYVRLLSDESNATIDGVALAGTGQSHDTLTHISHTMPHTTSDQIFRTVADSRGKTSFQGKVTVDKDAQKVEADQSFKALVFDRTAEANAKPELEIFADDVKCSHGATVGDLDAKAIFYLTSRGIDPVTARQMLVEAFAAAALERIEIEPLRDALMVRVGDWMAERKAKPIPENKSRVE